MKNYHDQHFQQKEAFRAPNGQIYASFEAWQAEQRRDNAKGQTVAERKQAAFEGRRVIYFDCTLTDANGDDLLDANGDELRGHFWCPAEFAALSDRDYADAVETGKAQIPARVTQAEQEAWIRA